LFAHERFDPESLMAPARRAVVERLQPGAPLVVLMDDTLMRKRGRKIPGAKWRRDPLGPPFSVNFVWGQRFLQLSACLPEGPDPSRARAVPIELVHCPSPAKPPNNATDQQREQHRKDCEAAKLTRRAAQRIAALRQAVDADGQSGRPLIVAADGGFTNTAVVKTLPERTAFIGRLRKDAKLYATPAAERQVRRGPKRLYGAPRPTPEQLRNDDGVAWQSVQAFAAGRIFDFKVKTLGPVRWRGAGARDLRLLVIAPLAYRQTKNGRLNYRRPSYLICTDPGMSLQQIVQAYLWRWEIEVNFRDQKTLLGAGQAQVRTPAAAELVPVLIAAAYAYLHLALTGASPSEAGWTEFPRPRWRRPKPGQRCSTGQALNLLRVHLWGQALGVDNYSHFVRQQQQLAKSDYFPSSPASALFWRSG
jgi:hypothetical protein